MKEAGEQVNHHLKKVEENYLITPEWNRFSNGWWKVKLQNSVRGTDLYILSDIGNYGITYLLRGKNHEMSPDQHFQDIKKVISATSGHANKIHLIMPLLYQARQYKRTGRESLDCAIALQELEQLNINDIITFDAHAPNVSNVIPHLPFENFYPTNVILNNLLEQEKENMKNLLIISLNMKAMERTRYYAKILGYDVGVFYKRRDLSKVINGENPIVEHVYLGTDVKK